MKTRYFLGLAFATINVNGKEIEALIGMELLYYTKMVLRPSKDILSIEDGL